MRELKFRVWDKEAGEYLEGEEAKAFVLKLDGTHYVEMTFGYYDKGKDWVIEQYTGLEDKNGKEIYEGDIIKWTNSTGREITAPIVWNTRAWCWTAGDYMLGGLLEFDIEVVGNIHEDLKLLEDKN